MMSEQLVSTGSFVKMKLLTWFRGYTVVSRTDTPLAELVGSNKSATEWRLAKRAIADALAAETGETDPVHGARGEAEPTSVEYICPVDDDVVADQPGSCPVCSTPLEVREAD